MSTIAVTNTSTQLSGKTIPTAEGDYTITGAHTFDRDPSPPFVVTASSAVVPNLDADKLDGLHGPTGAIVGTTDTQTLSNKTLVAPTVSGTLTVSGAVTATGAVTAPGVPVWLHAAANQDATATAVVVDSVTITGLTSFDTLVVEITLQSLTQATAAPSLYSLTDGVTIVSLTNSASAMPANGFLQTTVKIRQQQAGVTKLFAHALGYDPSTGVVGGGNTWNNPTVTDWTGTWSLALRHGGVTAGGALHYSWCVTVQKGP